MSVHLPWPHGTLFPNARPHWAVRAKHKSGARQMAWALCLEAGMKRMAGPVAVRVDFHPPDRRRRDLDGAISAMKSAFDGIADAIGVDDSLWRWRLPEVFAEPIKGGLVVVEITDGEA